jgi:hypothetical protein
MVDIPKTTSEMLADSLRERTDLLNSLLKNTSAYEIPVITMPALPTMPTQEERHSYESSSALIERLAIRVAEWKKKLPEDAQPKIICLSSNGLALDVRKIYAEGHNGIICEGEVSGQPMVLMSHQAILQIACFIEKIEEPTKRYEIGFRPQNESA